MPTSACRGISISLVFFSVLLTVRLLQPWVAAILGEISFLFKLQFCFWVLFCDDLGLFLLLSHFHNRLLPGWNIRRKYKEKSCQVIPSRTCPNVFSSIPKLRGNPAQIFPENGKVLKTSNNTFSKKLSPWRKKLSPKIADFGSRKTLWF